MTSAGRASRIRGRVMACIAVAATTLHTARADEDLAQAARAVFDARCVACHACYNAPCQLDLSSFEGIARGATDERVYRSTRLKAAAPTRLGVDARDVAQWRERGFFSVLEPLDGDSPAYSILGRMLAMKRAFPAREVTERHDWMCPAGVAGLAIYGALGHDGMPHGFPALGDADYAALMRWLGAGAPLPADRVPEPPPAVRAQLADWERFFNGTGPRERLVARYFYEHLFLAHLHVESAPGFFYRLVRSTTPAPERVDEIASVRPYDDPGAARFYYRFVPVSRTLTHKTHITFALDPSRLARYRRWFLDSEWRLDAGGLPGYAAPDAANPFTTFAALPVEARYRFFLENARYFVMSFIRGPVCEGQMAVNVINDHFHVLFLDPSRDLSVTDPAFLAGVGELLALPSAGQSDPFESYYLRYKTRQRDYTAYRETRYAEAYPDGMGVDALWDGNRVDPDAALTVFRHFDNAAVVHGLRGGTPKTLWVMDYPIFERIYYLLVAGFNVYGNAFHQASTRLYMDNLRVESEDLFLSFLPPDERRRLRDAWYRGRLAKLKMERLNPLRGAGRPTRVPFGEGDAKASFVALVRDRLAGALRDPEPRLNVAQHPHPGHRTGTRDTEQVGRAAVERQLNRLTRRHAPFVAAMPDLAYLTVRFDDGVELYALIRNQAHLNVSFPLDEEDRRVPAEDSLVILRGVAGSYPNFLFHMDAAEVGTFVDLLEGWDSGARDRRALSRQFGIGRSRPDFWDHYDLLNRTVMALEGVDGAHMDLSKYDFR